MRSRTRFRLTLAGLLLTTVTSANFGMHLVRDGTLRLLDVVTLFSDGIAAGATIALVAQRRRRRR